ncbi:AraC-like DNA-binding protein [Actinoplanes lutulentus]|uniref:AraC-like DNA-binding protein n=1 Tax=Actinoplanes lutulentus TaxID=1287878 RepID=A0A327Z7T5_9ACTN|nr:AraC family transcriptional regulator [Actinoplanes lutulentus]MBB2949036.1 AraC-like DNA-binding protein [Actinoplanes lutulentus]RAK31360.1 AraC-like DNA-binding protein [Actinoplanes lutulentus]
MDVLSDALASMRTGRVRSARMGWDRPWAQAFAPVPGSAGFHVVLHGECWMLRDDAEPLHLTTGDVVFRPHGEGHVLADAPGTLPVTPACDPGGPIIGPPPGGEETITLCGAYELEPDLVHPLISSLPEVIHLPAQPGLGGTVAQLAAELSTPGLGSDALVPALLDTMLVQVLRTWLHRDHGEHPTGWSAALRDPVTGTALRAMHRDPARDWTVAALAAEAGLSRAPFARRFTALLGLPPLGYLTWWRMTTAAGLLRRGDQPLRHIAERVGYGSEFAFAAAFKRRFGVAPGRYRRARPSAERH